MSTDNWHWSRDSSVAIQSFSPSLMQRLLTPRPHAADSVDGGEVVTCEAKPTVIDVHERRSLPVRGANAVQPPGRAACSRDRDLFGLVIPCLLRSVLLEPAPDRHAPAEGLGPRRQDEDVVRLETCVQPLDGTGNWLAWDHVMASPLAIPLVQHPVEVDRHRLALLSHGTPSYASGSTCAPTGRSTRASTTRWSPP